MPAFSFSLESVLQHRRRIEEDCQRKLAAARAVLMEEQRLLAGLEASRASCAEDLRLKMQHNVTAAELLFFQRYSARLAGDIAGRQVKVAAAAKDVELRRTDLVAALKKRQVLDKLKEKQMLSAAKLERRQEQDFANEMAVTRYARPR
ncbi:MAG: flagellar export protein FliJ [Desulfobacterales bacterium]